MFPQVKTKFSLGQKNILVIESELTFLYVHAVFQNLMSTYFFAVYTVQILIFRDILTRDKLSTVKLASVETNGPTCLSCSAVLL